MDGRMDFLQTVERFSLHGWDALGLSNGLVEAVCVPEIGGRLMQFRLGSHDFLFMNPELLGKRFSAEEHAGDGTLLSWKNYGGAKTWPAPQGWDGEGQWPGPPDPVLDSGLYSHYSIEAHDRATVSMTSPPDPRSGLQITREISLDSGSSRLQFDLRFMNSSTRVIRWSIWDLAQILCSDAEGGPNDDCWLYIPTDPKRERPYEIMFGDDNPQYQLDSANNLLAVQYQGVVGKIGVHSPAGWIAFVDNQAGYALCMQFPYHSDAEYPDNGATVECWTEMPGAPSPIPISSPGYILEAEVLSPLYRLEPAEIAEQRLTWSAARCPGPIVDVQAVGCVHQPLTVDVSDGLAQVSGIFGCFVAGRAVVECLDAAGEVVHVQDLGEASPLSALQVDAAVAADGRARLIRLNILDGEGAVAGALASVGLPSRS